MDSFSHIANEEAKIKSKPIIKIKKVEIIKQRIRIVPQPPLRDSCDIRKGTIHDVNAPKNFSIIRPLITEHGINITNAQHIKTNDRSIHFHEVCENHLELDRTYHSKTKRIINNSSNQSLLLENRKRVHELNDTLYLSDSDLHVKKKTRYCEDTGLSTRGVTNGSLRMYQHSRIADHNVLGNINTEHQSVRKKTTASQSKFRYVHTLDEPLFLDVNDIDRSIIHRNSPDIMPSAVIDQDLNPNGLNNSTTSLSQNSNIDQSCRIRVRNCESRRFRTRIGDKIYDLENPLDLCMRYIEPGHIFDNEYRPDTNYPTNVCAENHVRIPDCESEITVNSRADDNQIHCIVNETSNNNTAHGPHYLLNENDYKQHHAGEMDLICSACGAKFFRAEKHGNRRTFDACCNHGQIELNLFEDFPNGLKNLFNGTHVNSRQFFENIRKINTSFSFASFNAKLVDFSSRRPGPYCFKIQGKIHYKINTAVRPAHNEDPSFGQLFIYDSEEAVDFRTKRVPDLDRDLISEIDNIMREKNPFAESYMMMYEQMEYERLRAEIDNEPIPVLNLAFTERKNMDRHRYNIQRSNEVAAIFKTTADGDIPPHSIIIRDRCSKNLLELHSLNPQAAPMSYPLFFPNGQFGWHIGMRKKNGKKLSRLQHFKYLTSVRDNFSPILRGGRLFQQFLVGEGVNIEKDRLDWNNNNQKKIRVDSYQEIRHLKELLEANNERRRIGKIVILPSTFVGSPRYMIQKYQDAMKQAGSKGLPDVFSTMTCNPNWPEIRDNLYSWQQPSDRPDLVCRVFHMKILEFQNKMVKQKFFGQVTNFIYSVEFQKRGLPHVHFLIGLLEKIKTREMIDKFVSAEIPNPETHPRLHRAILTHNIHGPCGDWCKVDGKCSKKYPMPFQDETRIDDNEYPIYRRRNDGKTYMRPNGYKIDNRHVVPYNAILTLLFDCHINVEIVTSLKVIKYIFKYILKGHDAAAITVSRTPNSNNDENNIVEEDHDEILWFAENRYMGPCEAFWRAFFRLHVLSHTVVRLPIHLQNEHSIIIDNDLEEMNLDELRNKATMLTAFFELNIRDPNARQYTYSQIPEFYVFDKVTMNGKSKYMWVERKKIVEFGSIGRLYQVSPSNTELFHLRILLLYRKGITSFEDMKNVCGVQYNTYAETCLALGLIEDDNEWIKAMEDGSFWMMPKQLRRLFARIIMYCQPSNPEGLWDRFKIKMAEDMKKRFGNDQAVLKAFKSICHMLQQENKNPRDFFPNIYDDTVTVVDEEDINSNVTNRIDFAHFSQNSLSSEQRNIINKIIERVSNSCAAGHLRDNNCFFINGPGGSGKTFLYKSLYNILTSENKSVCMMAFTGIAATLLPKGKTIHKVVGLPVPMFYDSSSNIKLQSKDADYLKSVDLFIVDEAPMAPRYAFEIFDKLLKELMQNDVAFGGKIIVLGGDFKQILPVLQRCTRDELIDISIRRSKLWHHFQIEHLTQNMRVFESEKHFSKFLLELGNGGLNDDDDNVDLSHFPPYCVMRDSDIVIDTYFDIVVNKKYHILKDVAILSPRNVDVDDINNRVVDLFEHATEKIYRAIDTADLGENGCVNDAISPEYLNSLNPPSLQPFELRIRKNCVIMLIRNLSIDEGLCNGTRLRVKEMRENAILCEILTGDKCGETVFLCRTIIRSDNDYPFSFKRLQFPVKLAFAMTINKSQGQTFKNVSIDLKRDVFTHGQLYVALSRVRSWSSLKIYPNEDSTKIKNYVFEEILL